VLGQVAGPDHVDLEDIDIPALGLKELQVEAQAILHHVGRFQDSHGDVRAGFHEARRAIAGQFQLLANGAGSNHDGYFFLCETVDLRFLSGQGRRKGCQDQDDHQEKGHNFAHVSPS